MRSLCTFPPVRNGIRSLLAFVLISLQFAFLKAQTGIQLTQPIQVPSPIAASLAKYADIPISHYTGVPNISVQLQPIVYGDMHLDLSLNYHGGGVKVEEEAGWVGLSWAMNAGGVITRTIRGEDDFPEFNKTQPNYIPNASNGFFKEGDFPNFGVNLVSDRYSWHKQGEYEMVFSFSNPYPAILTFQNALNSRSIDGQADIFNFNFNGKSGKFVIDKPRNINEKYNIILFSQDDLRLELIDQDLTGMKGFKITDDQGVEYWFEKVEKSRSRTGRALTGKLQYDESIPFQANCTSSSAEKRNIRYSYGEYEISPTRYRYSLSSWFLTKMVSPNGATVRFNYNESTQYLRLLPSRVQTVVTNGRIIPCTESELTFSFTINEVKNLYLNEIVYGNSKITFNKSDRTDMQSTNGVFQKKLDNISYFYKNSLKRKWKFYYSYFNSGTGKPDFISKRLRLDSVSILPVAGSSKTTTSFKYRDGGTLTLPDKDSYAQDLYGFYNGKLSNDTKNVILPYFPYYVDNQPSVSIFKLGGQNAYGDREVYENVITAGMLERITYPTKGYSLFEFESNDFYNYEELNYFAGNYHLLDGSGGQLLNILDRYVIYDRVLRKGSGCRIKNVTVYSKVGALVKKRHFAYGLHGKLMYAMKHLSFYNFSSGQEYYKLSSHSLNSYGSSAAGTALGYSEVEERTTGPNGVYTGREWYKFENEVETNNGLFVFRLRTPCENWLPVIHYTTDTEQPYRTFCSGAPFVTRKDMYADNLPNITNTSNGNLLEHRIYNTEGNLNFHVQNIYEERFTVRVKGAFPSYYEQNKDIFTMLINEKSVFKSLKEQRISKDGAVSLTEYMYDPHQRNHQVYAISKIQSDQSKIITRFKYFTDYLHTPNPSADERTNGINALRNKNIFVPIEETVEVEKFGQGYITGGKLSSFHATNGKTKDIQLLHLAQPIVTSNYTPSTVLSNGTFQRDSRYVMEGSVLSYNHLGNPLEVLNNSSQRTAYAWGYDGEFIIGEAQNSTVGEFTILDCDENGNFICNHWENMPFDLVIVTDPFVGHCVDIASGLGFINLSNQLTPDKIYELIYWDNGSDMLDSMDGATIISSSIISNKGPWKQRLIRFKTTSVNTLLHAEQGLIKGLVIRPMQSRFSKYNFEPLVGMTSMTDTRGVTEYYEYDSFGRLSVVKDFEGNILKTYCYNYAGQEVDCF